MSFSTLVILLFATLAFAAPLECEDDKKTCSTSNAKLVLPAGQTALAEPTGDLSFVLLGVGLQNYTCSSAGNYTSAGAVADLFDLSCLSKKNKAFENIQDPAFEAWSAAPGNSLVEVGKKYKKLGAHFFIKNNSSGISPVWDFRGDAAPDKPDAFVLAARVAGLKAPTGSQDVDWLQLKGVGGGLGTSLYRTHTKGGQPPASCTPGSSDIQVKYVSKYWFYGGTVTLS